MYLFQHSFVAPEYSLKITAHCSVSLHRVILTTLIKCEILWICNWCFSVLYYIKVLFLNTPSL